MKITILDSDTLGSDISLAPIEAEGNCTIYGSSSPEKVEERIADTQVIITNKIKLRRELLSHAKNLELICVTATGYDNVDLDYCRKNNIAVCNIIGYSSHSVAQVTAAAVLSLSVNLKPYQEFVASGAYTKSGIANKLTPVYHELWGKTWGIVGYGNIGKEVGAIGEALGCKVIVNKKTPDPALCCTDIDTLCKTADIITIHTPLTEETRGLISKERLALMKKDVIIVNTARGAVTDEEAICDAVLKGDIGGFATDVYSTEPFDSDHPFNKIKDLPNVCLTPHMAWGSYEARCRCIDEIVLNIQAYKSGEKRNRVDLI